MPVAPLILGDPNETIDAPHLILSAAQLAMQRNYRMKQMENQLNAMNQRAQTAEEKLAFEDRWHGMTQEAQRDRLGVAEDRLKLDSEKAAFQRDKWGKDADALSKYQSALFSIDAKPGTQEWEHQANLLRANPDYSEVARTTQGEKIWQDAFQSHKQTAREITQSGVQVAKDYYQNLSKKRIPEDWLSDGKDWGTNKKDGSRFVKFNTETFERLPDDAPEGPKVGHRTVSGKEYETIQEQQKRLRSLGESDSTLPADVPPPVAPKQTVMPAPADPSARKPNTPYVTPKGVMVWTGTGWRPQ